MTIPKRNKMNKHSSETDKQYKKNNSGNEAFKEKTNTNNQQRTISKRNNLTKHDSEKGTSEKRTFPNIEITIPRMIIWKRTIPKR